MDRVQGFIRSYAASRFTTAAIITVHLLIFGFSIATIKARNLYTAIEPRSTIHGTVHNNVHVSFGIYEYCHNFENQHLCVSYGIPAPTRKFSNCTQPSSHESSLSEI